MTDIRMRDLATIFHKGQFRKGPGGVPYIEHPRSVVNTILKWGVSDKITLGIAWGHDLLEDTECPQERILVCGGPEVLKGITMLTHHKGEDKDAYLKNLARNAHFSELIVKCADRFCNALDFKRIGQTEYAIEYLAKGRCLFERFDFIKHYDECLHLLKGD